MFTCENQNQTSVFFNTWKLLYELRRPKNLNLSGTYQGKPCIRSPGCTTPQQPTIHLSNRPKFMTVFTIKDLKDNSNNLCKVQCGLELINNC